LRFRIDDVFFTAEEIKYYFGIGSIKKNGQPDQSKRWPKGKEYPCKYVKFKLSEKHTKFEKIILMIWTFTW
jgi:hypothetical protein